MRKSLYFIILLMSLASYMFNHTLGSIMLLFTFMLFIKPIAQYLSEYVYGVEFIEPKIDEEEGEAIYIVPLGGGKYRVGTALKILEVNYNVIDLDESSFLGLAKEIVDGIFIEYDMDYKIIYVKKGSNVNYFIQIAVEGNDLSSIRTRLLYTVSRVKRVLENAGIRVVVANAEDIKYPINLKPMESRLGIKLILFLLGGFLLYKSIFPDFIHINPVFDLPLVFGFSLIVLAFAAKRGKRKYMLEDKVVVVTEDLSSYRPVNPTEYYNNAINIHNSINKSPYDIVMIITVSPLSSGEFEKLNAKYYGKLKWGEAMGRFEWLDESKKLRGLLDRRNSGEMLYKFRIIVFTAPHVSGVIKSLFESLGFVAKIPYTVSKYIDVY